MYNRIEVITDGVNFTNVLQAAFMHVDPKNLHVFFALLGSVPIKALHKMLVKSTPGWEFTKLLTKICNILCNFKVLLWSIYSKKIATL